VSDYPRHFILPSENEVLRHGSHANIMTFRLIRLWFEEVQEAWHTDKKKFPKLEQPHCLDRDGQNNTTWHTCSFAVSTHMKPELRNPNYKIPTVVIKLLFLWILISPYSFHEYRHHQKQVKLNQTNWLWISEWYMYCRFVQFDHRLHPTNTALT